MPFSGTSDAQPFPLRVTAGAGPLDDGWKPAWWRATGDDRCGLAASRAAESMLATFSERRHDRLVRGLLPRYRVLHQRRLCAALDHHGAMARYRWRTALRKRLPHALVGLGVARKGRRDCGDHEWYLSSDKKEHCYHCVVGVRYRD